MINFAFYGRVSTEDQQDPLSSRAWQLTRSRALIASRGGHIVTEFFDVDKSRSIPWQRRPEAARLLAALGNPGRGFDAVVIGEPHRAFYGSQYGLTFPLFEHHRVPLWVPEVGGPIDPANEAHDLVMSVFGGKSKGERNRVKVRVRAAMASQATGEGRFLGGRPPYGYQIANAGPHPNPAKAADGKRLHKLDPDPGAFRVVQRIFAEFTAGHGIHVIAEGLDRDRVPCPSAHDPARNQHRSGAAWTKGAVRAILANPRYTGHQVWNRQRKDEVLLDVHDVALGHVAKLRWNDPSAWLWSEKVVQPPVIDRDVFEVVQAMLAARAGTPAEHKPHRSMHPYLLGGCVWCALCGRRMQGHWLHDAAHYRCRLPAGHALPRPGQHPRSVTLRENLVLGQVQEWVARELTSHRISKAIRALSGAASSHPAAGHPAGTAEAPDAAGKARHAAGPGRTGAARERTSKQELKMAIDRLAATARMLTDASSDGKSEAFRQLCLKLTYHPAKRAVEASIRPSLQGFAVVPGQAGGSPWVLTTEFALSSRSRPQGQQLARISETSSPIVV